MSYKKTIITAKGYSRLQTEADGGATITFDLDARKTIRSDGNPKVLIPFHAIDRVVSTKSAIDQPDRNPYGCVPQRGIGGKVCDAVVCTDTVGC